MASPTIFHLNPYLWVPGNHITSMIEYKQDLRMLERFIISYPGVALNRIHRPQDFERYDHLFWKPNYTLFAQLKDFCRVEQIEIPSEPRARLLDGEQQPITYLHPKQQEVIREYLAMSVSRIEDQIGWHQTISMTVGYGVLTVVGFLCKRPISRSFSRG